MIIIIQFARAAHPSLLAHLYEFTGVRDVYENVRVTNVSFDVAVSDQPLNARTHITKVALKLSKERPVSKVATGTACDDLDRQTDRQWMS